MPNIPLDEFDDPPEIGDKVIVTGKVLSIDEDTDEVEISYDKVRIKGEKKNKKRRDRDDDDDDDDDDFFTRDLTVDQAMAQGFPNQAPQGPPGPGAYQA